MVKGGNKMEDKEKKTKIDEDLKKTLKENNELLNKLLLSGDIKKLKLKKVSKGQKKKGYINYLYIRTNGCIETMKIPSTEMTTLIEDSPRLARPEEILSYKGTPTIIQPEWSSQPFSMVQNYNQTVKDKMLSAGYRLLALRAEQGNIKPKRKLSGTVIFFLIVALLVVGYLVLS